jgi:hypothetical protein
LIGATAPNINWGGVASRSLHMNFASNGRVP